MPDSDEGSSPPSSPWKLRSRGIKRKADCDKSKKKPATSTRKKSKHDSVSVPPKHNHTVKESSDSKEIVVASSPPTKLPSYKAVVQLLAKPVREEEKSFTNRSGVEQKRIYLVYKCPKTKYIGEDAEIIRHKDFESGVCKIQNGSTELNCILIVNKPDDCYGYCNLDGNIAGLIGVKVFNIEDNCILVWTICFVIAYIFIYCN